VKFAFGEFSKMKKKKYRSKTSKKRIQKKFKEEAHSMISYYNTYLEALELMKRVEDIYEYNPRTKK